MLQVTDPGTQVVPRQQTKNPKRVAAGRAAAASKKNKHEKLLEELRAAKESLNSQQQEKNDEMRCVTVSSTTQVAGSMTPWILGAAGLVCLVFWAASQRARPSLPTTHQPAPAKLITPSALSTDKQLKNTDPFYME